MSIVNVRYTSLRLTIITAFLIVCHGVPYVDSQRPHAVQNRNFVQFGNMVIKAIGNPLGYNGYGCWCGKGNRGDLVVDATDRCCQVHDNCWGSVEEDFRGCNPFWRVYSYKTMSDGSIQCKDPTNTCDYHSCQCDKAAVECFSRHRNTTYDPDFDNWQGLCNETSNTPEADPDRCPPVWNKDDEYARNSSVSINGIIYQSLFSSAAGQNPTENLYTSDRHGIMATWKKLGRCRRTDIVNTF